MDNYVLRLRPETARKFFDALRIKFNSPAESKGKLYSWDTLIRVKAQELANYILDNRTELNFDKPAPNLNRADSETVRNLILSLTTAESRKLGIGKSTLSYLQQRARSDGSFRVYSKVRTKLSEACL